MKEIHTRIRKIIEFTLFVFIIFFLFCKISWIFRGNPREPREDIVGFKNQGTVDVVFYGGSNLLRYYQPLESWNQKGYTSYNYATSSAKADLLKVYIEESRASNEALLYVCDIRSLPMVNETIDDPSIRNWSDSLPIYSPMRIEGITSYIFSRSWKEWDVPSFYFDIAKYHSNYESLADSYQWSYVNTDNIYNIDKGFDPNRGHIPFETPALSDERGELTEQQEKALNELLDYCDKENLQVLFIVCPYIVTDSDWKILNTCGDIIQGRGYDFINFNNYYDEIGIDFETDFGDVNHVNYLGAEKYTEYLMNYITDHYDLPDHRGDGEYAKWDEDYNIYISSQNQWKEDILTLVNNHMIAKELGDSLSEIENFDEWFKTIQNESFTVIIKKNNYIGYNYTDDVLNSMISTYGIDMSQMNYIGLWYGGNCIFYTNADDSFEGTVGVSGGREIEECIVCSGEKSQMSIGGTDYYNPDAEIQVLVYDNNYKKIIDNVVIQIDDNGNAILSR